MLLVQEFESGATRRWHKVVVFQDCHSVFVVFAVSACKNNCSPVDGVQVHL